MLAVRWGRILRTVSLLIILGSWWAWHNLDGITVCIPPDYAWTILHPRLDEDEYIRTVRHEQVHREQIRREGCVRVILSRISYAGRMSLENEAFMAEY